MGAIGVVADGWHGAASDRRPIRPPHWPEDRPSPAGAGGPIRPLRWPESGAGSRGRGLGPAQPGSRPARTAGRPGQRAREDGASSGTGSGAPVPAAAAFSAARAMLRAMPPKTTAWNGETLHQYTCPSSPRGWNSARCR